MQRIYIIHAWLYKVHSLHITHYAESWSAIKGQAKDFHDLH